MPNKIDDFKEYARKRIVEKLREESNASKIETYDEPDAEYEGTDEEYKEFLSDIEETPAEEPAPVENTQRIGSLGLHSVFGKMKETAEKVAEKAVEVKSSVFDSEDGVTRFERPKDDEEDEVVSESAPEPIKDISSEYNNIVQQLNTIMNNLSDIRSGMNSLELKANDEKLQISSDNMVIKDHLDKTMNMTLDIKNTINSVSKLNDSIFDLKNSQQNVKVAVSDVEAGFKRLKSKCMAGFTIMSIIGIIIIALEVVNLLS